MNWIKVEDELPPLDEKVLVNDYYEGVIIAWRGRARYGEGDPMFRWMALHKIRHEYKYDIGPLRRGSVTHWMPLPKSPDAIESRMQAFAASETFRKEAEQGLKELAEGKASDDLHNPPEEKK